MFAVDNDIDVAVIGGGVVGLSTAYFCALRGYSTAVIERHEFLCSEASTHNSGVIHSGFNPEPGTLKAFLNKKGLEMMYSYAEKWKFGIKQTGTLVAASRLEEIDILKKMKMAGEKNGVPGLSIIEQEQIRDVEPEIKNVHVALYSPMGGVIDIAGFIGKLTTRAKDAGVLISLSSNVTAISTDRRGVRLSMMNGDEISSSFVVNAAGVESDRVASLLGGGYSIYPCVGEYAFAAPGVASMIRGMVYPVVGAGYPGLGIHLTKTIDGALQIGPTAVYADCREPLNWKRTPLSEFHKAIAKFLPEVQYEDIREGWYGVRAKIVPPGAGSGFSDFIIEWDRRGFPAIHLVGIESPGFTSCLAIGEHVAEMIEKEGKAHML